MAKGGGLAVTEMQNGYNDTWDIGGSRFGLWSSSAFDPDAYVGTTQVVNMALLSAPPTYGQIGGYAGGGMAGGGQSAAATQAAANPWSPTKSPNIFIIVGLALSLYGLHWLYYKDRRRK